MKRIISSLLIAILIMVQLTPNIPMVYAQEVSGEDVTYSVDKAYDVDSNTTSITVKAQPGFDAITVDSITTPEGEPVSGSQVTYVATANGSYHFTINYTSQTKNDEPPITSGSAVTIESDVNVDQKTLDVIVEVTDFTKKEEMLMEGVVEIDETNFPDPTFREYVRQFDVDNSNSFDQSELDNVNEIGTERTGMLWADSIEGIQYFTELKELNTYSSGLTEVNVSNNTKLEVLSLMDAQIKTLDLTKNVALKKLWINYLGDAGKLRTLDISKNVNLTDLYLKYTKLSGLNISNNPKLVNVSITYNYLKKLDVSNNIALKTLDCSDNQLKELNVEENSELVELKADNNHLESINLKNNKDLEILSMSTNQLSELDLSENGALKSVVISANQLKKLDVSHLKQLEDLSCVTNQLTALDMSKNTLLKDLYLEQQQVYYNDIWVKNGSIYEFDMKKLVGPENLNYILSIDNEDGPVAYNKDTGIISASKKINFIYQYDPQAVGSQSNNKMDVSVNYTKLYSINAIAEGNGSITPSGATWLEEGMDQEYTITPNDGYRIDQLIVNGNEVDPVESFTIKDIKSHQTIEAVFKSIGEEPTPPKEEHYIFATTGYVQGEISPAGVTTVKNGGSQTYNINPKDGMEFEYLLIDNEIEEINGLSYTFTNVTQNHRIEAVFKSIESVVEQYNIESIAGEHGTIFSKGPNKVNKGDNWVCTIIPYDGYTIDKLKIDDVEIPPQYNYTFSSVMKDHKIEVSFKESDTNLEPGAVAINDVNFPEINFRSYVKQFDNIQINGILEQNELEEVTTMLIAGPAFKDLTGLENFQWLKELTLDSAMFLNELNLSSNTALEKLEVIDNERIKLLNIDHNINLKELIWDNRTTSGEKLNDLNLSNNTQLKKLKLVNSEVVLDVSSNTELEELISNNNSNITELDLNNNTKLKKLDCRNNANLASISLEKCTALEVLYCSSNSSLNKLDVSNNKELTSLACVNNPIKVLDLSGNPKLISLNCDNTQIKKLDLEANKDLKDLSCSNTNIRALDLTNNKMLEYIYCSETKLTKLDLTNNKLLDTLFINSNDLSILDVSNCPELKALVCAQNNLTSLDVRNNTKLTALICDQNQLTKLDVSKNIELESLSCSENQLTKLELNDNMALRDLMSNPQKISKDKTWIKKGGIYELNLGDIIGKENLKYVIGVKNDLDEKLKFCKNTGIIKSNEQCEFSYMYDFQLKNIIMGADFMEVSVRLPGAYSIYASADPNGSITPEGETRLKEGLNQSYTIKPNTGYEIDKLLIDGKVVSPVLSYTFKKIYEDHNIDVTFKEIEGGIPTPPVDPPVNPGGGGGDNGGGTVDPPVNPGGGGGDNGGGTVDPPVTPPGGGDNGGGTVDPPVNPGGGTDNGGETIIPPVTPGGGSGNGSGTVTPPTVDNNTETITAGNNNGNNRTNRITEVERPNNQTVGKANRTAPTTKLQKPQKEELSQSNLDILGDSNKDGNGNTQHPGFGATDQQCILHILILLAALILAIYMLIKRKKDDEEDDDEEEIIQKGYRKA